MNIHRSKITVIVPAGNRSDVVEDCLKSVRWADELLVVDSFSADGTFEIAERYADRVLRNEYGFSAKQKNWAIPQASHEWVLLVDTDERVTENLKNEIFSVLQSESAFAGYRIPRVNYLFGSKVSHAGYYPDYQVRLFKRDAARYQLRRVHAHVILDGECGTLQSPLVHYAHRDLDQTLRNLLIQMTTWEAEERMQGMRKPLPLWFNILFRPIGAFGLRYFAQAGWKDGYRGLAVSVIWAMYVAITYLKIWESGLKLDKAWWQGHWSDPQVQQDGKQP